MNCPTCGAHCHLWDVVEIAANTSRQHVQREYICSSCRRFHYQNDYSKQGGTMYTVHVRVGVDGWREVDLPITTTEGEANVLARNRSLEKPAHVYAVIEDGKDVPHTIFLGGEEFQHNPYPRLKVDDPDFNEDVMSDDEFCNWLSKHHSQPPSPRHG